MSRPRLHTTTVRFSREVWARLKQASERDGVATAQYIREATVRRLAAAEHAESEQRYRALDERVSRLERVVAHLVQTLRRNRSP